MRLIRDGDTLGTGGFVGIGFAEGLANALERRFLETGEPRKLAARVRGRAGRRRRARPESSRPRGLVDSVVGGHWGLVPKLQTRDRRPHQRLEPAAGRDHAPVPRHRRRQARHLTRASGSAPSSTRRFGGGILNERTTEELVRRLPIDGEDYLFYKAFPINACFLRGTTGDPDGNITMEREALTLEALALATATRNSGGIVIAQVERIAERGSLSARQVKIPGILVDCVVVAEDPRPPADLRRALQPGVLGEIRVPVTGIAPWAAQQAQADRAPCRLLSCDRTPSSTSASACPRASPASPTRNRCSNC